MKKLHDKKCPCSITNSDIFPWWVWLANTGHLSEVSNSGIMQVWVVVTAPLGQGKGKKKSKVEPSKHLIVESENGIWMTRPDYKCFHEISRDEFRWYIEGQH